MTRPALAQVLPAPLLVDGLTIPELLASKRELFGGARMDNTPDGGGGDGGPGGDGGDGAGDGDDDGGADGEKKFTQADLNRATAEARSRGERQGKQTGQTEGYAKFLADLGLPETTKPEDVKAKLAAAQKAQLDALSDGDRAKEEARLAREAAEQAKADAEREKQEARQERHDGRVQSLLERAGVGVGEAFDKDPAKRDVALARAAKLLDVEVGADSDDIRKSIEALKKDMPALFGTAPRKQADGRPTSTPTGGRNQGESPKDAGRRLAEKRGWVKPAEKVS